MDREDWVGALYLIGIAIDWAYWVARGVNPDGTVGYVEQHVLGAFTGVPVALLWPLHILVEAWFWVLS